MESNPIATCKVQVGHESTKFCKIKELVIANCVILQKWMFSNIMEGVVFKCYLGDKPQIHSFLLV